MPEADTTQPAETRQKELDGEGRLYSLAMVRLENIVVVDRQSMRSPASTVRTCLAECGGLSSVWHSFQMTLNVTTGHPEGQCPASYSAECHPLCTSHDMRKEDFIQKPDLMLFLRGLGVELRSDYWSLGSAVVRNYQGA